MAANVEVLGLAEAGYALEDFATAEGNLWRANLSGANLHNAFLYDAGLQGANLSGANLRGASYDANTKWPEGVDPQAAGAVMVDD